MASLPSGIPLPTLATRLGLGYAHTHVNEPWGLALIAQPSSLQPLPTAILSRYRAGAFTDLDQETDRLFATGTDQLSDHRALTSRFAIVTHWQQVNSY